MSEFADQLHTGLERSLKLTAELNQTCKGEPMARYECGTEVKILRKKHRVIISQTSRAKQVKEALANVPNAATFDEYHEDTHGGVTLVFHEEVAER